MARLTDLREDHEAEGSGAVRAMRPARHTVRGPRLLRRLRDDGSPMRMPAETGMANIMSSDSDDYMTPDWLKRFFDSWDDPCPFDALHMDGLLREWRDPVFANIPYSETERWIDKAISESRRGTRIVLLIRVDTSTKWWLKLVDAGARIALLHDRIYFNGKRPPFASALVFLPGGR